MNYLRRLNVLTYSSPRMRIRRNRSSVSVSPWRMHCESCLNTGKNIPVVAERFDGPDGIVYKTARHAYVVHGVRL